MGAVALAPMVATGVLWGTIGVSVEQLKRHGGLSNVDIAFWRAVVASSAVTAFAIVAARRKRGAATPAAPSERPSRRNIAMGLLCGTSTVASQICYFAALGQIGVGPATLVALGLGPLLVAIGEATFLGRRPSPRLLGVVAVSVIGTALLVGGAGSTAPDGGNVVLGLVLATGSAATYATVVLTSGTASHALGAAGLNLLVFVGSALSLTPVIIISGLSVPSDAEAIAVTVYLGLIASALAYGLYFLAARTLKSTVISILALLEPLTAAILAWIIFGQSLNAIAIAGGALLLGGVIALSGQDNLVAESAPIGAAIPDAAD